MEALKEYAKQLDVVVVEDILSLCTTVGGDLIKTSIHESDLNRIIVVACTPKTHESVFLRMLQEAGLNRGYLEFVNIREQVSFVHRDDKEASLQNAKDLLRAAVERAKALEEITTLRVKVNPSSLVIGGGVAGLSAALNLANEGFSVYLVEKLPTIGGYMAKMDRTFPTDDCAI